MKRALVTGGAQGIGRAVVERLARDGWAVVIVDIDAEAGDEAIGEINAKGLPGEVAFIRADVAEEADVQACIEGAVERFGGLEALINNAGIADPITGPVETLDLRAWQRVLDVNLTGALSMTKHAVPHLAKSGGAIVNVTSTRARQSEPETEAYTAAKGGLEALTRALAVSLAHRVRVNAVAPGWIDISGWKKSAERAQENLRDIDHAQHPTGRVGRPEDVAGLIAWLIGDEAGFVTGQSYVIDGGMTVKMIYED